MRSAATAGLGGTAGDAALGLLQLELLDQRLEAVAVLGEVDGVGDVPRIGTPAFSSGSASFSGVWPPNCTMTPLSVPLDCSTCDDLQHVLGGQRLEVEPVGGVVVGGDGLGVAVDHDGLEAGLREREAGMAAAVVELDALADAVGSAAEDDDLVRARTGRPRTTATSAPTGPAALVGGVHVGGGRGELGRAGVDALEDGPHAEREALLAHLGFGQAGELGEPRVGEAHGLQLRRCSAVPGKPCALHARLGVDDLLDAGEEPGIDLAGGVDLLVVDTRGAWPARP